MPWDPKDGETVKWVQLPYLVRDAWINGDIENLRYHKETERFSFHVTGNKTFDQSAKADG